MKRLYLTIEFADLTTEERIQWKEYFGNRLEKDNDGIVIEFSCDAEKNMFEKSLLTAQLRTSLLQFKKRFTTTNTVNDRKY